MWAILKTVGFVRGQARRVVAWQATFIAMAAVVIGLPLGILIGRWLWTRVANSIGVVPQPSVTALVLVLLAPAVILLANLIAAMPGALRGAHAPGARSSKRMTRMPGKGRTP